MAKIEVEEKQNGKPKGNSKWYIIAVIVIISIIVAWIALSEDNRADVEIPPEPVVLNSEAFGHIHYQMS
ncbi:hypothetical protein [Salinimicrobium sp. HB62]|uniref:hypothetical protein n=1 Tax=Salinimicrobium sp. HB62 TaxID=3077781 RepID=UPI002D764CD8|nr:hypothetical protein [Salinimicrobium sp. HB62]